MARKLKIWNGRCYGVLPSRAWKRGVDTAHIYACAHSIPDLMALCAELGLNAPSRSEIRDYWSHGCWGDSMDGITPERGMWVQYGHGRNDKPVKIKRGDFDE